MRRMGRPGLFGTMARTAVVAGTATAVAGSVRNHQEERYAQQQAAQGQSTDQAPEPVSTAPSGGDEQSTIDQLKELASLKEQGVLTDEEFAAQKAKILAS